MNYNKQLQNEFTKLIQSLSGKYPLWQVWSDFITITAIAISNVLDKANAEQREKDYHKVIGKYDQAEQKIFPKLFAIVIEAFTADSEQDFLGAVYMALNLGNHWIGQFFTPYSVCKLMAQVTIRNVEEEIEQKGYITLNDCACGAGATLIAGVNEIKNQLEKSRSRFYYQNHLLVTAQDIDYVTGLMCYIQLSLLGVAGFVKIGDSLTEPMTADDDKTNYWYTPMYFSDVWHYRRLFHSLDRLLQPTEQKG